MIESNGRIWFILGPSGTGKSHISQYLAAQHEWHHLEIDRFPEGDGIDLEGLRKEWTAFYEETRAVPLIQELEKRVAASGKADIVLSFPGNLVGELRSNHISALREKVLPIILIGKPEHCLAAFLRREEESGRGLPEDHWHCYNDQLFAALEKGYMWPWRVDVFDDTGQFKSEYEILEKVNNLDER